MAKITFDVGDQFAFKQGNGKHGVGVVTSPDKAFIITGQGGRTGYQTSVGPIPSDAVPETAPDFVRKFALDAVISVLKAQ